MVNEDVMKENLDKSRGIVFSQKILLELIEKGLTRLDAYNIVQDTAMQAQRDGIYFKIILENDRRVKKYMTKEEINRCFDFDYYLCYVGEIFKRVGI